MSKQEVTNLTIMEWNIHQQGLYNKNTKSYDENLPLPMWIIDEFKERDIVILTEYCHRNSKSGEFVRKIREKGYNYAYSTNTSGNDVLIAIKNNYPIVEVRFVPCGHNDDIPENLRVDIKVGNDILSVIGVRIKNLSKYVKNGDFKKQAQMRAKNMEWIMHWVKDISNPIVITGDFNNYRRATPLKEWNLSVLDGTLLPGFTRKTPIGQSIYKEKAKDTSYEFAEDHFIINGLNLNKLSYYRDFVMLDKTVYQNGKDLEDINIGYPDHAILKGDIEIRHL